MRITFVLLIFSILAAVAAAQPPNFDHPYFITNEMGYILESNEYLSPEFGDWDDDGDLDMMLGVFYNGNIYYFENISSQIEPEFAPYEVVEADGSPIQVTYG